MTPYDTLSTAFYALDKPTAPPDAFDFYERHARAAGGPVHEPMCGTGRFLLPLLAQGIDISGSDVSMAMLGVCSRLGRDAQLAPRLTQQSLQQLSLDFSPRLLMIPSGSFGLLIEDETIRAALSRVHGLLAPGGKFLVEVERWLESPPETSGTWGGRWVEREDGARIILSWLSQYSGMPNVTTSIRRYELVDGGRLLDSEYEEFRVRSYAAAEFHALLTAAGFTAIEALKPYTDEPADADDDAFVFSCRKPETSP